jgi:hypothetical protein
MMYSPPTLELLRIYFGFQSVIVVERVFRKRIVDSSGEN